MNDFECVTNSIQLISRLKKPSNNNAFQHSFSKIIRQQAITLQQESSIHHQYNHMFKNFQDNNKLHNHQNSRTEESQENKQKYHVKVNKQSSKSKNNFLKTNERVMKVQKIQKKSQASHNNEKKKGNILIFDQKQQKQQKHNYNSKKQKRDIHTILQSQKTKKQQFEDNYHGSSNNKNKKQDSTSIKQSSQDIQFHDFNLQINSCQNSSLEMNTKDLSKISGKLMKNYAFMVDQTKELINILKYQHIENQKIELRKKINKSQNQIRRLKIGCRGMSNLISNTEIKFLQSKSKMVAEQSDVKRSSIKKKQQKSMAKVEPRQKPSSDKLIKVHSNDQKGKSNILSKQKQNILQIQIAEQRQKQQKLRQKCRQLQQKYHYLYKKYQKLDQKNKNINRNGSIMKRNKLLQQKVSILKQQIKQTKSFYNNKIKRNKNQNELMNNQIKAICYQLEQLRKNTKDYEKNYNNYVKKIKNVTSFQEENNMNNLNIDSKIQSNKQMAKNTNSAKAIKNIKSFNSIKSTNCVNNKPSIGSLNSFKSTNIEQKSRDCNTPVVKGKLKLCSPHFIFPIKIQNETHNDATNKRQIYNSSRQYKLSKEKKSSSLDIAFEELQKKYSKHLITNEQNCTNEYYENDYKSNVKFGSL